MRFACLALAAALLIAGCGQGAAPPSADNPPLRLAWRATAPGGGQPSAAAMNEAAQLLTLRLRQGLRRNALPPVTVRGADELLLPHALAATPANAVTPLLATGHLAIVDWEPNVIGPDGRPAPTDASVTGGDEAGLAGAGVSRYSAVRRAARSQGRGPPVYYVLGGGGVLAGPLRARPSATRGARVVRVPGDIALVQGQTPDGAPAPAFDVYYVLRYQPLLGDGELVDPRSSLDRSTGAGNAPVLTFRLTPAGAARVRSLSRTVALRGLDVSLPGDNHFQHFAVLLDGRIVAVPFIDFVQFPGGVDTSAGAQIEGGMSADRARALAAVLRGGPLPVTLAPLDS